MAGIRKQDAMSPSPDSTPKKIYEIVLWWCVWGEAVSAQCNPQHNVIY